MICNFGIFSDENPIRPIADLSATRCSLCKEPMHKITRHPPTSRPPDKRQTERPTPLREEAALAQGPRYIL